MNAMFLTGMSFMYRIKPPPRDRWWKVQRLKEQGRHFWFKSMRSRLGLQQITIRRGLVKQTKARLIKPYTRNLFRNARLDAAAQEHDTTRKRLRTGLHTAGVKLNSHMLCILSIYEPRSFESLVELAERSQIEKIMKDHIELPERSFSNTIKD